MRYLSALGLPLLMFSGREVESVATTVSQEKSEVRGGAVRGMCEIVVRVALA